MNVLTFIATFIAALVRGFFSKSKEEQLGASKEKVKILEKQIAVREAMKSAKKISKKDQLINILRKGKLIIVFAAMSVCACAQQPAIVCQDVKEWSRSDQVKMVIDLNKISANSPLVGAMEDYFNMREEARACRKRMRM